MKIFRRIFSTTLIFLFLQKSKHHHAPCSFSVWSESINGGGWTLVRRVKKGTAWHPATDHLAGTDEYGTLGHETSGESFSIRFNDTLFNQFLFATGKPLGIFLTLCVFNGCPGIKKLVNR